MNVRRRGKRRKAVCITALLLVCVILALSYLNNKLDPLVCSTAIPQLENFMTRFINDAVTVVLSSGTWNFVSIKYGDNGRVLSIETDSAEINLFRAAVTDEIAKKIAVPDEYFVYISMSNIMDDEIFFSLFKNWKVEASVTPNGKAETTVESSLESAGINQSIHKITLSVTCGITALLLISTVSVETVTDICIAETVIIGDVPAVYLGK